jgi:uncharacterized membrane protein
MTVVRGEMSERWPRVTGPGLLIGIGIGGLIDGVVLHQVLQWHHMLTDYGDYATFPRSTVGNLEDNTLADGLFHVATLIMLIVGLVLLWRALATPQRTVPARALVGLLLAGWGTFNLVEGIVDHHVLTVHHVRDDVSDPLPWDLGFLAVGALLLLAGTALYRSARPDPSAEPVGSDQRRPTDHSEPRSTVGHTF